MRWFSFLLVSLFFLLGQLTLDLKKRTGTFRNES